MLVHDGSVRGGVAQEAARALWYPLWDAGLVLGNAQRTPKEALALAREDVDTLTGLMHMRVVMGDLAIVDELLRDAHALARRRRDDINEKLAIAAWARAERPGPIAEMLEPNLKEGAGGLRDVQALEWAGWTLDEGGGLDGLVAADLLEVGDIEVLEQARAHLLDVRVELHRATGTRSDVLTLQEQDAVAHALDVEDADDLIRALASVGRSVQWISGDVWRRLAPGRRRARRLARKEREVEPGIWLRRGAVELSESAELDARTVLRAAAVAARRGRPLSRATLERARELEPPAWDAELRAAFVDLLRLGHPAIPVIESLDQVGVLTALLPEWVNVRARPQRNAYHRFTVDRHLLEAVAECAGILDERSFDGDVARRTRPELLLLGALLHDIGKGLPDDDHSVSGAAAARTITTRMDLDPHGIDVVSWLVRSHLLLADTATRRDLTDSDTIIRFGRAVRDTERLDLLYALTVGDSRATGSAAWGSAKAALVRQLFVEADRLLEEGVVGARLSDERREALEQHRDLMSARELAVRWGDRDDELLECIVVAPDRAGLLATVAGVLAVHGFDIRAASAYGDETGMAVEVYRGVDTFGRIDADGRRKIEHDIADALAGRFTVRDRLDPRARRYRRAPTGDDAVEVRFDLEASTNATVCEVHAPDDVGLLARIAAVFTDLELDVTAALVSTLGDRVVDVFYVRDAYGAKLTEPLALDRLRATLVARLTADTLLT
jgi:[protein-PII] uridylyltransferase